MTPPCQASRAAADPGSAWPPDLQLQQPRHVPLDGREGIGPDFGIQVQAELTRQFSSTRMAGVTIEKRMHSPKEANWNGKLTTSHRKE